MGLGNYPVLSNICGMDLPTAAQLREWAWGFLTGVGLWDPEWRQPKIQNGTTPLVVISYFATPKAFPNTDRLRAEYPAIFTAPRMLLTI